MRIPFTHGGTLLHVTAPRNLAGLCRWLLDHGAAVNRGYILGRTALHHAVRDGAADTARLLIARGADLDARDWQGRTPLDLAEAGDGPALARAIREEISLRHTRKLKAVKLRARDQARETGSKNWTRRQDLNLRPPCPYIEAPLLCMSKAGALSI